MGQGDFSLFSEYTSKPNRYAMILLVNVDIISEIQDSMTDNKNAAPFSRCGIFNV